MATETVYADAHITGNFTNSGNAVGNTPTTWAGVTNENTSQTSRWSLANLTDPLATGQTHTVNVSARKGSNSGNPTLTINLYENGTLVSALASSVSITSTSGQVVTGTFSTSAITNPDNIEIEAACTAAGGNPSTRNAAQIAYIELVAEVEAAAVDEPSAWTDWVEATVDEDPNPPALPVFVGPNGGVMRTSSGVLRPRSN